jgi:hypothetical protein
MILAGLNNNDYWSKAFAEEMTNVFIMFDTLVEGVDAPDNLKKLCVHLIFEMLKWISPERKGR